jgi:hypothetical protein
LVHLKAGEWAASSATETALTWVQPSSAITLGLAMAPSSVQQWAAVRAHWSEQATEAVSAAASATETAPTLVRLWGQEWGWRSGQEWEWRSEPEWEPRLAPETV